MLPMFQSGLCSSLESGKCCVIKNLKRKPQAVSQWEASEALPSKGPSQVPLSAACLYLESGPVSVNGKRRPQRESLAFKVAEPVRFLIEFTTDLHGESAFKIVRLS